MKNFYHVLQLPNFASVNDIRRSYRKLALKYHPDRGGDVEKMKELNQAYEHLTRFKDEYDAVLTPARVAPRTYGFTIVVGGFDRGYSTTTTGATTFTF